MLNNFEWQDFLLTWVMVEQGPTVLAVGVGWGGLDIFPSSIISLFFPLISRRQHCIQHVLRKYHRDNQNLLASDRCLLNTGAFECTVELQWLKHLWNHEIIFEKGIV